MGMLDDELMEDFRVESLQILEQLNRVISNLRTQNESAFPEHLFAEYAQKVDRIMGTVQTFAMMAPEHKGLAVMGNVTQLCKRSMQDVAKTKNRKVFSEICNHLSRVTFCIKGLIKNISDEQETLMLCNKLKTQIPSFLKFLADEVSKDYKTVYADQIIPN